MRILLISHGDYGYDGRLRELIRVFQKLGHLYAFTRGTEKAFDAHTLYKGSGYVGFIRDAIRYGKNLKDIDVLVLDNRKATIPGMLLRQILHPKATVQDCRELYISREIHRFSGKVGCYFERMGIQRADVIICANHERAEFMKEMYQLKELPLVYENLRQLEYSSEREADRLADKFAQYIHEGELRIITTSGCNISRTNDILVQNLDRVERPCRLFMVGGNSPSDLNAIKQIVAEKQLANVEIIGQLNQDELKYLISQSHIGIVNYHQKNLNNRYCASGKLFEFIYEGIPVVTTTNPPLKRLCDTYQVGIADDTYAQAINTVAADYETYCSRVKDFGEKFTVKSNNETLLRQLLQRLEPIGL